jgi:hypothetical protein
MTLPRSLRLMGLSLFWPAILIGLDADTVLEWRAARWVRLYPERWERERQAELARWQDDGGR